LMDKHDAEKCEAVRTTSCAAIRRMRVRGHE
jgi:hypothetical protein